MKLSEKPKDRMKAPVREQEHEMMVHWFANGQHVVNCWDDYTVKAIRKASDGDWKTQSVRKDFMGLREGETAELLKIWTNFYGKWCRVKRQDGRVCDIAPDDLELVIPEDNHD